MNSYKVIGLMSGSSLDGLDLAACEFKYEGNKWTYRIDYSDTSSYDSEMAMRLKSAIQLNDNELRQLSTEYGSWLGQKAREFCEAHNYFPDFISSHGHTIFHQPALGKTLQIGEGNSIFKETNIPVINDFRTPDVLKGGQGAPLVPIGDELLFSSYTYCLNLGGIANISLRENGKRIAYDICPVNMALNFLSEKTGKPYDDGGLLAQTGKQNTELFNQLNRLDFFHRKYPKSLGVEWFNANVLPLLENSDLDVKDLLNTYVHHIVFQISQHLNSHKTVHSTQTLLLSGGGSFNKYLVKLLESGLTNIDVVIPNERIVNYKESLIFAFLGVLRIRNETNCLSSVTGASSDSCTGTIHGEIQ